ncbi:Hsp20 family protein [Streptomyces sp. 8N114]
MPPTPDAEHISAELTSGILTMSAPKAEKGKAQRMEITD